MLHWVINNNICFLTVVEQYLSKDKNYKGIIAQIIEPIYDFKKNNESFSKIIYIITFILWLITINRIFNGYSSINKQIEGDLFTFEKFGLFLVS